MQLWIRSSIYTDRLLKYQQLAYKYGLYKTEVVLCQNRYQFEKLNSQFPEKEIHILHNPIYIEFENDIFQYENRKYIAWLGVFQRHDHGGDIVRFAQIHPDSEAERCAVIADLQRTTRLHRAFVPHRDIAEQGDVEIAGDRHVGIQ